MNIEKLINSRVFSFFDWVWKLVILNLLTLITSLGIITILPSFVACYETIRNYDEGVNKNVFSLFYRNFAAYFKRTVGMGILILVVLLILGYAFIYYGDNVKYWIEEGYDNILVTIFTFARYFILFIIIMIFMITIQLPMVYSFFNFRFFDNIRFAFYVTFKFIGQSLLSIFVWALSFIILIYLLAFWFFVGFSVTIYLIYRISIPVYRTLINKGN